MFKKIKFVLLAVFLFIPMAVVSCNSKKDKVPETTYRGDFKYSTLSIGNGSFSYAQVSNKAVLLDAGTGLKPKPSKNLMLRSGPGENSRHWSFSKPNKYYNWIKNTLMERGVKEIEAIIISHDHADHYNQLLNLAKDKDFKVKNIVLPYYYGDAIKQLKKSNFQGNILTEFKSGWNFLGIKFENLAYYRKSKWDEINNSEYDPNATSMIIRFTVNGKTFLFTGDSTLEDPTIVSKISEKPVDVYVVPHHGGSSVIGDELVSAIGYQQDAIFVSGTGTLPKWVPFAGGHDFPAFPNLDRIVARRGTKNQIYITGLPKKPLDDYDGYIGGTDSSYEYEMTQKIDKTFDWKVNKFNTILSA